MVKITAETDALGSAVSFEVIEARVVAAAASGTGFAVLVRVFTS